MLGRARALGLVARAAPPADALRRALDADTRWGLAAALWIGTGLWRWLGGLEKGTEYYDRNHFFYAKMTLLAVILLLELWPVTKLVRWRGALRRGAPAEAIATPGPARRISIVSTVQAVLVVLMVVFAAGMARGLGAMPGR